MVGLLGALKAYSNLWFASYTLVYAPSENTAAVPAKRLPWSFVWAAMAPLLMAHAGAAPRARRRRRPCARTAAVIGTFLLSGVPLTPVYRAALLVGFDVEYFRVQTAMLTPFVMAACLGVAAVGAYEAVRVGRERYAGGGAGGAAAGGAGRRRRALAARRLTGEGVEETKEQQPDAAARAPAAAARAASRTARSATPCARRSSGCSARSSASSSAARARRSRCSACSTGTSRRRTTTPTTTCSSR